MSKSPTGEIAGSDPFATRSRSRGVAFWTLMALGACAALSGIIGGVWLYIRFQVAPMPVRVHASAPDPVLSNGEITLAMPNGNLVGMVGEYADELTAYLRLQYLKSIPSLADRQILMMSREQHDRPIFKLYINLRNDLLAESKWLAQLEIERYITTFSLDSPPSSEIDNWTKQTLLFEEAYHRPMVERLIQLPESQLHSAVARFILFKVRTDPRVRRQLQPVAEPMTPEGSQEFAADMIAVAKFYDLPLDMLLGIGAMENNYLDERGDLKHAVWKKRPQKGDIVLKRRHGRVLVSNYSIGPWQLTRETLRYVHSLYLGDKRDYSQLPERLRPPRVLDLSHVDSHVLTVYAGLLLRTLLDYFHGDVNKAEGAYNGGAGRPNLAYAQGVSLVATYAHRVLSMAAGRKGIAVKETPLQVVTSSNAP